MTVGAVSGMKDAKKPRLTNALSRNFVVSVFIPTKIRLGCVPDFQVCKFRVYDIPTLSSPVIHKSRLFSSCRHKTSSGKIIHEVDDVIRNRYSYPNRNLYERLVWTWWKIVLPDYGIHLVKLPVKKII